MTIFVDLPNIYSQFVKYGIEEPEILREYFISWLDFDLLSKQLTGEFRNIWVFYSGNKLGPSEARVSGKYLGNFIERINYLEGVTAYDVNIPGEQREAYTTKCDNCGKETTAEWLSEKGIDASITVHLFDTMDFWREAYLLSGDADYVPVVRSLRRRGKTVLGGGFPNASSALIRECFKYIDLYKAYLEQSLLSFLLFRPKGIVFKWLTMAKPSKDKSAKILKLRLFCSKQHNRFYINFKANGSYDSKLLEKEFLFLSKKYNFHQDLRADASSFNNTIFLKEEYWDNFKRKKDIFIQQFSAEYITIIDREETLELNAEMLFDRDKSKYNAVKIGPS